MAITGKPTHSIEKVPRRAALYARVSDPNQHPEMQLAELKQYCRMRGWQIHKVYCDRGISGAQASRPQLDKLLADCRRRKEPIDVVLVWKFDRFARSMRQLIGALEEFRALGIDFVSCTEAIDTSLPHGELIFQILAAIGQWERSLIGERVSAGLANARRRGQRLGRPPLRKLTDAEATQLRKERARHKTPFRDLARKFGISLWSAHQMCGAKQDPKTTLS